MSDEEAAASDHWIATRPLITPGSMSASECRGQATASSPERFSPASVEDEMHRELARLCALTRQHQAEVLNNLFGVLKRRSGSIGRKSVNASKAPV